MNYIAIKSEGINNTLSLWQSHIAEPTLMACHNTFFFLLMPLAAGPPVCLCCLIFPAGFSFKALRWALKQLLRQQWRPPSDFPSLSPPVHCPFQWLIYGPHKCVRDAEISEEVINRTKPRKRRGKRKQPEEVTGTCRVRARARERKSQGGRERIFDWWFQSVLL